MVPPKLRGPQPLAHRNGKKRGNHPEKGPKAKRHKTVEVIETSDDDSDEQSAERKEFLDLMKGFLKSACQLYTISSIHNIAEVTNFKRYERALAEALREKCKYRSAKLDWLYQVKLKKYNHVKANDKDGGTISLEVLRKATLVENDDPSADWVAVLRGIFTCRDSKRLGQSRTSTWNSPVLLISGPEAVFKSIQLDIQEMFSCFIHPVKSVSPSNLKLIFGQWLISLKNKELLENANMKVDIEFCVFAGKKLVTFEASVPIWYFDTAIKIREPVSISKINKMWYDVFKSLDQNSVNIDYTTAVSRIKSPTMRISKDGKIRAKIMSEDLLFGLISSLTSFVESGTSSYKTVDEKV